MILTQTWISYSCSFRYTALRFIGWLSMSTRKRKRREDKYKGTTFLHHPPQGQSKHCREAHQMGSFVLFFGTMVRQIMNLGCRSNSTSFLRTMMRLPRLRPPQLAHKFGVAPLEPGIHGKCILTTVPTWCAHTRGRSTINISSSAAIFALATALVTNFGIPAERITIRTPYCGQLYLYHCACAVESSKGQRRLFAALDLSTMTMTLKRCRSSAASVTMLSAGRKRWQTPTSVKHTQMFNGFAGFCRRLIKGFSEFSWPRAARPTPQQKESTKSDTLYSIKPGVLTRYRIVDAGFDLTVRASCLLRQPRSKVKQQLRVFGLSLQVLLPGALICL